MLTYLLILMNHNSPNGVSRCCKCLLYLLISISIVPDILSILGGEVRGMGYRG